MKQPIEDYFSIYISELNLQNDSLTNFIDFIIINEIRFLEINELSAIIKFYTEHNSKDKIAVSVYENYLYCDVQSRIKLIKFHDLFDELKEILEIKDKFIDEIEYSSDPVKLFIQKDSEYLFDILYGSLENYAINLSKYSFKKYFLQNDYFGILKNKESTIKIKLAKEILRFHYIPINLEELAKKLIYIVLLEINSCDVPIKEISFAERFEQILSNYAKELTEIEISAKKWFKDFRKQTANLVLGDLIAKNGTIKIKEEKINFFGFKLLFDMISLSKFSNILQIQNNNKFLQLEQNNPIVANTKNYVKENCDSPFCLEELRDFVKEEMNNILILINDIELNEPFDISNKNNEELIEKTLKVKFKKIFLNNFSPNNKKELFQLSKDIFEYCLTKSNKDVTFDEISNVSIDDILNNSNKIYYSPIFGSLKETIHTISKNFKNLQTNEIEEIFYELIDSSISSISSINKI